VKVHKNARFAPAGRAPLVRRLNQGERAGAVAREPRSMAMSTSSRERGCNVGTSACRPEDVTVTMGAKSRSPRSRPGRVAA